MSSPDTKGNLRHSPLGWFAGFYVVFASIYFLSFVWRFRSYPISYRPADWTSMAEMLSALFGLPLALWSVALVLDSLKLQREQLRRQQDQYDENLTRENLRLDPIIEKVELAKSPMWQHGTFGGKTFHLTVRGDATWQTSTIPGGANPAAITNPDKTIEVVLWKRRADKENYRGFISYTRSNGTCGWYWISAFSDEDGSEARWGYGLSKVSGPTLKEDGLHIEADYEAQDV